MDADPIRWAQRLERLAANVLAGTPLHAHLERGEVRAYIERFHDGAGFRLPTDRPMLAWILREDPGPVPPDTRDEVLAWWGLHGAAAPVEPWFSGSGPLLPHRREAGIESWTEAELSALHARSRGALSAPARARLWDAAAWIAANLQPDNATQRPWACHVFVWWAMEAACPDPASALHYADTLAHNSIAVTGEPDVRSAFILADSARALRAGPQAG